MVCRLCEGLDIQAIEQSLDAYILRIDKDQACEDRLYQERLRVCKSCDRNREGLCGVCGCFVRVRAYKKHMTCPSALGNKWLIE